MQKYFKLDILIPLAAILVTLAWSVTNVFAAETKAEEKENMAEAASALFNKLDENGDGYVTLEEAAGKIAPDAFSKADTDHDGRLSLAEFTAANLG